MNEINFIRQRESDNSDVFYDQSNEGSYENYKNKNLPEGYTAYQEIGQVCELVYDQYGSIYSQDSLQEKKLSSFVGKCFRFKIGWFLILQNILIIHDSIISKNLFKDSHWRKVTNIVYMQQVYFLMTQIPFQP